MKKSETENPGLSLRTLNSLRYGLLMDELSLKLEDCVKAATETGKMATLTLNLKIKPEAQGAQIFITDEIKTKIPTLAKEATIFFPEDSGNLLRSDPRQTTLPGLKTVENPPIDFKQATGS